VQSESKKRMSVSLRRSDIGLDEEKATIKTCFLGGFKGEGGGAENRVLREGTSNRSVGDGRGREEKDSIYTLMTDD